MQEHPNASKYREISAAMDLGRYDEFLEMIDDDIEWWEIGRDHPVKGKAAWMERMQEQSGNWEITGTLHDVVANDEHLVALVNAEGKRGEETLSYRTAEVFHIKDGKITHRWAFSDDTAAINQFFA